MATTASKMLSFLLDPTYHWVALAAFALLLALFNRDGVTKILAFLTLYIFVVIFSPLPYWMLENLEVGAPALESIVEKPAVVVLSGGTVEFNQDISQFAWYGRADRILVPLRNWRVSSSLFIITGRESDAEDLLPYLSETDSMGQLAGEMGVPQERIVLEISARSTRESAGNVAKILREKGIEDFYLVTSAFHMKRSVYAFRAVGLNPTPFPVDYVLSGRKSDELIPSTGASNLGYFRLSLHEYIGYVYYHILDFFA